MLNLVVAEASPPSKKPGTLILQATNGQQTADQCESACEKEGAKFYPTHAYTIQESKTFTKRKKLFTDHGNDLASVSYHDNYYVNMWRDNNDSEVMKIAKKVAIHKSNKEIGWNEGNGDTFADANNQIARMYLTDISANRLYLDKDTKSVKCICEIVQDWKQMHTIILHTSQL